jgi:hypothetical protein
MRACECSDAIGLKEVGERVSVGVGVSFWRWLWLVLVGVAHKDVLGLFK